MDWNHTATTTFGFSSWFTSPMASPTNSPETPLPTIPEFPTILIQIEPPTLEPTTSVLSISLAVRIVLFVICLIENSIAIFILHKSLRNERKTFSRYTMINMACSDILRALIYYPAEFVKFSQGEFVWFAGDVLCKIYNFLAQIPDKVLALCLVALACDVTRNLSSKGRREHTRKFSKKVMGLLWAFAYGFSVTYISISKVESKKCIVDPAELETAYIMDLLHRFIFVIPANLILAILNVVIYCRVKRGKKEIARIREERWAGRMKVRRQKKQFGDAESAEVQQLTQVQEMLSSKSRESDGEDFTVETSQQHHTSINPSDTLIEIPIETNEGNNSSDVDVDEEDDPSSITQTALEEAFDMTREEAKIEGVIAILFVIVTPILLILVFTCEDAEVCSAYVFFAVQIMVDIYGVIKPGIYAYADKDFRKRYKQLSPFALCCLRRIQCHTVPQQVETRNNLSYNEISL